MILLFVAGRLPLCAKPENRVGEELVLDRIGVDLLAVPTVPRVHVDHAVFRGRPDDRQIAAGITSLTLIGSFEGASVTGTSPVCSGVGSVSTDTIRSPVI